MTESAPTQDLILDAAERLFARQGFTATTIKQIGRAASVNPALLYYYSIYLLVHNEAVRHNEPRLPEDQIVPLGRALLAGWRHLLPLAALIWLLVAGYTPVYVAAGATAAVIVLSWFHRPTAIGPRRFVECCTDTITQLVPLVGAVAAAGVVVGAIEISALAGKFTLMISAISGGLLVPTLLLSALFLILLGMGMPTPAVYIMGAALLAPVLRGVFNLPEMQVHLFMLYFACLSAITPPVAVANFAAGAIADVNPMALGPYAVKLAIGGFILPFYFLFNPGLNMQGGALYILECIVFAVAMCTFASFAMLCGVTDLTGRTVHEVTTILGSTAAAKQIPVRLDLDPALGPLRIDPARLKQVLYNYLSNALKFTPVGGAVKVSATPEDDRFFRIEVEDNGPGVAPEDAQRLFVPFQQLESGMSRRHGGTASSGSGNSFASLCFTGRRNTGHARSILPTRGKS